MGQVITMSHQELNRVVIFERIRDRRLTQAEAANLLGLSDRHVRRLYKAYQARGAAALVSRKRGSPGHRAYSAELRQRVIGLVKERYPDFGPTLIGEKLSEPHDIHLSRETLRPWLMQG